MTSPDILSHTRETGDFTRMLEAVPYAKWVGLQCERFGDDLIFRLPRKDENLGNPILPAIHGGVIGGFMELSAAIYLMMSQDTFRIPRIVDFSLDYLRAGLNRETYAECHLTRQGNRVANVMVTAWQKSRAQPIATARAHFLLED
ncbi:MAG TPA: PaaI family thioesterase [Marinobacter sp.]|nr:PaaI family thioesterase [Marinobacter sp.]